MQAGKVDERLSLSKSRMWIGILVVLLIISNIIVFIVYQQSHLDQSLATALWEYMKSDPFKYITISLVLPIILFFWTDFSK